jgi:L-2-hydroxyglutarate oxidase
MNSRYDVAVVGGGIVGVSSAMALASQGHSVVLLEAGDRLAPHQSSHNSGVIHAGLYYRPGTLKAQLCVAGRAELYRFCEEEGVPHRRCGKLVVATRPRDVAALDELERRGRANGLSLRRLGAGQLTDYEPAVTGMAGLWVAETGVVDYRLVTEAYARRARALGTDIVLNARVRRVTLESGAMHVATTAGETRARFLVNCAGLQSDRVARLAGADPGVRIVPFRGEYFDVKAERAPLVRGLIYPVPNPALPFLGIHLSRTVHDHVHAGPNAVFAFSREGYSRSVVSPADLFETATYGGFWRMARRHWRSGASELRRSFSTRRFARSVQELVPDLEAADLVAGGTGVRAQAIDRAGNLLDDFHLVRSPRALHVLNAPSPAATASLAIGRSIATQVREQLG